MAFEALQQPSGTGFDGALSGMTLADLIQIKNLNRFTGCLTVEHARQKGVIFFRDGDLVHAELGEKTGSSAFYAIMLWPGGEFRADPKIVTTCHTVSESLTYLLLEAHRLKDENFREAPTSADDNQIVPETTIQQQAGPKMSDINTKLNAIPEVKYAIIQTKEGNPIDDDSYEASTYAANGFFLSLLANQLSSQLGTGDLISAAVHGTDNHLLLFQSKNHYLNVTVNGSSQLGPIEAAVRKSLVQK
jgi:predicted regulator of Ras-like GTPase activity (Roadblock/LC7/MglB family)